MNAGRGGYTPSCEWPEACGVQWGDSGVVIQIDGCYRTAFFEAFPGDYAGGFIRGEGATIEDAEQVAFKQWSLDKNCEHAWSRKSYTNGGGICRKCTSFTTIFKPIVTLADRTSVV